MSLEHLQGWGSHNLAGQLSHDHPPGEKFLPYVQLEFHVLQFVCDNCLVPFDLWEEHFHYQPFWAVENSS